MTACEQAVWDTALLCAQWKTPDDGQRNCPKHVEFYSKNKLEKLVHLADSIIRIYHDAHSPERQKGLFIFARSVQRVIQDFIEQGAPVFPITSSFRKQRQTRYNCNASNNTGCSLSVLSWSFCDVVASSGLDSNLTSV